VLDQPFDFALLDIELMNGNRMRLPRLLTRSAYRSSSSASPKEELPSDLRRFPFIAKPFGRRQIKDAILSATPARGVFDRSVRRA
jgi:hypothetical protein